jgi:quercetin dioxygenase-like cupin family protein
MADVRRWDRDRRGEPTEREIREELEERGFRVSRYVYPPGTEFPAHTHDVEKIDAVVSGRFRVELEGEEVELGPGDWVRVPAGAEHTAAVVGEAPVVSLDAARR